MTQKDYIAIAAIIADPTLHLQNNKKSALAARFADMLMADNPRFNRTIFYKACGVV